MSSTVLGSQISISVFIIKISALDSFSSDEIILQVVYHLRLSRRITYGIFIFHKQRSSGNLDKLKRIQIPSTESCRTPKGLCTWNNPDPRIGFVILFFFFFFFFWMLPLICSRSLYCQSAIFLEQKYLEYFVQGKREHIFIYLHLSLN